MGLKTQVKDLFVGLTNRVLPPFAFGHVEGETQDAIYKAVIPQFLYRPPFGLPRMLNIPEVRRLAGSPSVSMAINTIIDEVLAVPWEITGKGDNFSQAHVDEVQEFFDNPNKNDESWGFLMKAILRDVLEIDAGVWVKVFNHVGKMVEIYARDGGTFTKNPDIYGVLGNRAEILPGLLQLVDPNGEAFREFVEKRAAYFQYPWYGTAGYIVPFGHREIVYLMRNPRTDSIYGRSPVEVLNKVVQMLIFGIDHNLDYFVDNEIPKGVFEMIGANSDDIKRFREGWRKRLKVKDEVGNLRKAWWHMPIINTEGKFVRFQFSNVELELLEQQRWFSKIVWAVFGVTPSELGFTENSNRATEFMQSRVFRKKAIRPLLRLMEYHINTQIIPEFGYEDVEFRFVEYDIEEDILKHNVYRVQLMTGLKTINEIREQIGEDPVDWGEEPFRLGGMSGGFGSSGFSGAGTTPGFGHPSFAEGKSIEGKPFGPYKNHEDCVKKNQDKRNPDAYCAEIRRKIEGKEFSTRNNPLVLGPNEVPDSPERLEKSIRFLLDEKRKELLKLIEESEVDMTLDKIKAIDPGILDKIKGILTAAGLKIVTDAVIKAAFFKGVEEAEKQLDVNFIPDKNAIDFIQEYTFENIKDMTSEIANDLRQVMERGILEGKGPRALKEEVAKIFDRNEARAVTIARTEFNRAFNAGHQKSYEQIRIPGKKEWIAKIDEKTTEICKRLNGQKIDINKQFKDPDFTGFHPPAHPNCRSRIIFVQE